MNPEENFIQEYFHFDLDTGAGAYEKLFSNAKPLDWSKVKDYILSMKYFYFLKSSYWRIISEEKKRIAKWQCSCGCRESLQTHHLSYNHHGEEHLYMEDLRVLCNKCHQGDIHNEKLSIKVAEKTRQRNNRKEELLFQIPYYPHRISEDNISGPSFGLIRKLLEELEHERKVTIERTTYDGWQLRRQ